MPTGKEELLNTMRAMQLYINFDLGKQSIASDSNEFGTSNTIT